MSKYQIQKRLMPFNNNEVREPAFGKPHIVLVKGWWRVSAWKPHSGDAYYQAHAFALRLNMERHLPGIVQAL